MTQNQQSGGNQNQDQRRQAEEVRDEISRFLEEQFQGRTPTNINEVTQAVRSMPVERLLTRQTAGSGSGSSNKS